MSLALKGLVYPTAMHTLSPAAPHLGLPALEFKPQTPPLYSPPTSHVPSLWVVLFPGFPGESWLI